jgi:hypothetical protein
MVADPAAVAEMERRIVALDAKMTAMGENFLAFSQLSTSNVDKLQD